MQLFPPIKWHGGKHYLARKIISHMAPHTRYVEPFFGGGAVLLLKTHEGVSEYVNDRHQALTCFWRVLQNDQQFEQFKRIIEAVPFSQVEFEDACDDLENEDPIRRAVSFFIAARQSRQGLMTSFATPTSRQRRRINENVSAWLTAVEGLQDVHNRLRTVEVWCGDAVDVIEQLDSPDTLFYLDPPYVHSTRKATEVYEHEMSRDDHNRLLTAISKIQGKFLLSGYNNSLYEGWRAICGWDMVSFDLPNNASASKVKERKEECLWANYQLGGVL